MIEQMLSDLALDVVTLRYFNAAGADLETEIGENHTPETHLLPIIIQTALGLRDEIVVYGTDFESKDGSAVRDYIHVQDLAQAHIAALKCSSSSINLGTGIGYSVLEMIEAVQTFCGKTIPVRLENRRPGEPGILTADNVQARKLLDWSPQMSDLPTLVESAWKWHQFLLENSHLIQSVLKC